MTHEMNDNAHPGDEVQVDVSGAYAGMRLDQALAGLCPHYSRSRLKQWIDQGLVTVNGDILRPRDKVQEGDEITLQPVAAADTRWTGEAIDIEVVYEDAHLIVVNKAAGVVVHPAAGNRSGTLVNALLHYAPELATLPRAGIVHRLDKDTSGLLVVARSALAHKHLVEQLQARTVSRLYLAVVEGVMVAGGTVDAPIARHPLHRQRMAVVRGGREAITHYRVRERFRCHTLIEVRLETGRTHQIRVHMAHIHYPLLGDPVYGKRVRLPAAATAPVLAALGGFRRQALHAAELGLIHPASGETMHWQAELPADMQALIAVLREDAGAAHER